MHIHRTGKRVFVNEHEAIFTVAHVYHETQAANLVPVGRGLIEEDVPWRKLFRYWSSHVANTNQFLIWAVDRHQIILSEGTRSPYE